MESAATNLPEDSATLKQLINDLFLTLRERDVKIEKLEHELRVFRRYQFGRRSEKLPDLGPLLPEIEAFLKAEAEALKKAGNGPEITSEPEAKIEEAKKGHGRRKLPDHLPRGRIEHLVPVEKRRCPECGGELVKIGEEVTEQLDYHPGTLFVRQHAREKCACKVCQGHVVPADKPAQPVEKGIPGPGLLAQVLTAKSADHLPLHCQEGIFERSGVEIARSTMCDWVEYAAELLEPIHRRMKELVLQSKMIHTDETPVPVLDRDRVTTRQGRLWTYVGDREHPFTVYDYWPTRANDAPLAFLADYQGYLQADAYLGYDAVYATGRVIEVACWAHARRKFFDAKVTDRVRGQVALAIIGRLYHVEREARELAREERQALRIERSMPILEDFKRWLDGEAARVLPKSPMGAEIHYSRDQWTALTRFLEDGDLEIDNNIAERALRRIAVGRKN